MLSLSDLNTKELNHAAYPAGPVIVEVDEDWYSVERNEKHTWAWSGGTGRLLVRQFTEDTPADPISIVFTLVGELGCDVIISQNGALLWGGFTAKSGVTVQLDEIVVDPDGRAWLEFHTDGPVHLESGTGRRLAFAVYNVKFLD